MSWPRSLKAIAIKSLTKTMAPPLQMLKVTSPLEEPMSKKLTITLPDELDRALALAATQTNQSAEDLILQLLAKTLNSPSSNPNSATDPLLNLVGCISTDLTDVGENHDYYLGQALHNGIHNRE
jgi:hypothetical protein